MQTSSSTWDRDADARAKNERLRERLDYALAEHGYLACYLGGTKVHAAVKTTRGHSGYDHPRALCQRATPRSYASEYDPRESHREVTCLRCLASLQDLAHAEGAREGGR